MSNKYESRSFTKEWLEDNDLPYDADAEIDIEVSGRRWMDDCICTFQAPDDGFWYQLIFDTGKTEYQECSWDEYLDFPVECLRVERKEVVVHQWVPVAKTV